GVGLLVAPLKVGDEALERRLIAVLAPLVAVADDDPLVLWRVEQVVDGLLGQLSDGSVDVPAMGLEDRLGGLHPPGQLGGDRAPVRERAVGYALRPVGGDALRIDLQSGAPACAGGASGVRRVGPGA